MRGLTAGSTITEKIPSYNIEIMTNKDTMTMDNKIVCPHCGYEYDFDVLRNTGTYNSYTCILGCGKQISIITPTKPDKVYNKARTGIATLVFFCAMLANAQKASIYDRWYFKTISFILFLIIFFLLSLPLMYLVKDVRKNIGKTLIIYGVIGFAFSFIMPTDVRGYHNIGLLHMNQMFFLLSAVIFLAGIIFEAVKMISRKDN